jgi:hypothetical protein
MRKCNIRHDDIQPCCILILKWLITDNHYYTSFSFQSATDRQVPMLQNIFSSSLTRQTNKLERLSLESPLIKSNLGKQGEEPTQVADRLNHKH